MTDDVWKRDEIESPCVKTCVIHPESRLCIGCLRSIDEIGSWSGMTVDVRRRIIDELPSREPLIRGKRRTPRLKTRN